MFESLIKIYLEKYKYYLIRNENRVFANILDLDFPSAYEEYHNIINNQPQLVDFETLSNPFYLGMGNPNSNILIFGQELAFDPDVLDNNSTEMFFQEQLFHHPLLQNPVQEFFNPYVPNDYRRIFKHSHTWGIYSKWISAIINNDATQYRDYLVGPNRDQPFEDHCFFTELYDTPTANHVMANMSWRRQALFQSDEFREFIRSFDYVLISCNNFYNNYQILLNDLFDYDLNQLNNMVHHNVLNTNGQPYINGLLFKLEGQAFGIFNRQFSSAWSYDYIQGAAEQLKVIHLLNIQ